MDNYLEQAPKSKASKLDIKALENWLWEAACSIRGAVDAPKFKDYILPLVFIKRLSDVFDDEITELAKQFGDKETAIKVVEADHSLVRFFIPDDAKWSEIRKTTTGLGQRLTDVIRGITKENPSLQGVIDIVDFNATVSGQRIIDDGRLSALIGILSDPRYRLGINDVEPDILGRAYEYLLRKFAEGQGQSAGEFFTPKEVAWLMAYLLDPKQGQTVYDPTCGSGGLLIKCQLALKEREKEIKVPLRLHGQELNHVTFAIARMNMIIHDMEGEIAIGDSFRNPKFLDGSSLKKFDIVAANPMWNQKEYNVEFYENDPYNRFLFGIPPNNTADWAWIQHMLSSLKEKGKLVIVIDTGTVSRGSGKQGSDKEKEIRKKFVDNDYVEAVILLPENLFYNTTAPGNIIVVNKYKKHERQVLIINASKEFVKEKPKNCLTAEGIRKIVDAYNDWKEVEGFSKVITVEEVVKNDYNLSPSRYVATDSEEELIPIDESLVELAQAEEEKKAIDTELDSILRKMGFGGYINHASQTRR
ncbi:MAG: SAM-dependent DNA methyltransferase [Thaumarchaeota archaeon]|nr:SAM-dependent DNA methyltransferase [Nitrososphaerota archaeon]